MSTNLSQTAQRPPVSQELFAQEMTRKRDSMIRFITICMLVIGITVIVIDLILAATSQSDAYTQVKDILTFVNPFLGLVIGYYFQKATSDARAQTAEAMANLSEQANQQAQLDRQSAQRDLRTAQMQLYERRDALRELLDAAASHAELSGLADKSAPDPATDALRGAAQARLDKALTRARAMLDERA